MRLPENGVKGRALGAPEQQEEATMKDVKAYDGYLKMFREIPRPVDMARLHFLRWLAEHGRL